MWRLPLKAPVSQLDSRTSAFHVKFGLIRTENLAMSSSRRPIVLTPETMKKFNGVRARFQRLSDYRFFAGWVQDFFGERILLRATPDVILFTGQEFQFDVIGPQYSATFRARLEYGSDFGLFNPNAEKEEFELRQRIMVAADVEFEFVILKEISLRESTEEARYAMQSAKALVTHEGRSINGTVLDASTKGLGLALEEQVPADANIELKIETHMGEVKCQAQVRYCRPDRQLQNNFRTGVSIVSMDRIDQARWNRIRS